MRPSERRHGHGRMIGSLALLLVLLAGLLFLRLRTDGRGPLPEPTDVSPTPTPMPVFSMPLETAPPSASPIPREPEPESEATPVPRSGGKYNERSYGLVNDIVYLCKRQQLDGMEEIRAKLRELDAVDPALGALWTDTMEYWYHANTDMPIHRGGLPDGLPEDDSLCIVVLGYQLLYDGSMTPELIGRCETALAGAHKYPNAFIAATGGGTAAGNASVTEAGVMAAWFREHGIAPERIITEDSSLTTDQNARYTTAILRERCPQVSSLAIVTSDYHVPLGCLMFETAALLTAAETGVKPFSVISNGAWATAGDPYFSSPATQGQYLWLLTDPKY